MDESARAGGRLERLRPADLTDDQQALYDDIAGGRRAQGRQPFPLTDDEGRLNGPFNGFLLQPHLGAALQGLGTAVRYDTALTDRCREIAILIVAVGWDSDFEWYAHEAVGRLAGLNDSELAAIRDGSYSEFDGVERAVAQACHRLVSAADLTDTEYAEAVAAVGEDGVFELLTLVGYYSTLALQMRVHRVGVPSDTAGDPIS